MRVIIVDDERLALKQFSMEVDEIPIIWWRRHFWT